MATIGYLASATVMGLAVVATFLALSRVSSRSSRFVGPESGGLAEMLSGPTAWIVGFLLLAVGAIGGAVAFVGGVGGVTSGDAALALLVVLLAGLFGYVMLGTYHTARSRGLPSAHAAGVSLWAGGTVLLVGIVVKLVAA